ncbi:helix-turn-helix domain-containing protein [Bradyrhizobium sp. dw_411]|uniref:helix-turn-helix domain-containing protein n=1 Tax=Bradyrhizobium sp. dw_411 TaxID=2720082 RepID=UPI001BD1667F|nr:helix-turn-helix domain-containing protein [Bradyrhizobium sp. dw_411]
MSNALKGKTAENQAVIDRLRDESCEVLSVEEAGRKLGLGRAAAYAHAKAGHLPIIRLGNRMLVPKAAFAKLLASA